MQSGERGLRRRKQGAYPSKTSDKNSLSVSASMEVSALVGKFRSPPYLLKGL